MKIIFFFIPIYLINACVLIGQNNLDSVKYIKQGDSLYNLAEAIYNDWNEVYRLTKEASEKYNKAQNFDKYHKALISLASVKSYQFDLFGAINILDSSISIARMLNKDSPKIYYQHYLSKANIYKQYGLTYDVLENFKKSISIIDSFHIFQEDKLGIYARMAIIYRENGDLHKSEEIVQNALNKSKSSTSISKALALAVLGKTRVLLSKYNLAKGNLSEALNEFESIQLYPQQFLVLNELFTIAIIENSHKKEKYQIQIEKILEYLNLSLSSDFKRNLALLEYQNLNLEKSIEYYNEAVAMVNGEFENIDHRRAASIYYELGKLYCINNQYNKADSVMNKGINLLKHKSPNNPYNIPILLNLQQQVFNNKLNGQRVINLNELSVLLDEILRYYKLLLFDIDNDIALKEESLKLYSFVTKSLNHFYSLNLVPQFFTLIESNKSNNLFAETTEYQSFIKKYNSAKDNKLYNTYKNLISFYKRRIFEEELKPSPDSFLLEDLKLHLSENQINLNLVENSSKRFFLKKSHADFKFFNLNIFDLRKHISQNDIIYEYFEADSILYQMIITSDTAYVYQIQNKDELKKLTEDYISSIRKGLNIQNDSKIIFETLIENSEIKLQDYKNLIVIPDGFLHCLPFESLVNEDNQYLLETHNFEYQYSATLMQMLDHQDLSNSSQNDFAGYAYSKDAIGLRNTRDCNRAYSYDLLCSEKEINNISKIINQDQQPFYRTKSDFQQYAAGNKIIHLSTHACSDPNDHNLSRIYFEDDYMTTYEIASLNLDANLAVLSACETGTGQISKGEGVMSLAKSFFYAGCKSTIVSLWPVDDCSTTDIMMSFYKHLKSGKTKDQSLRLAKLDYIKTAHPERRSPYYWAGFILVGNNDALFETGLNNWQMISILAGLILLGFLFIYFKPWRL